MNTAIQKQQFHKLCECKNKDRHLASTIEYLGPWANFSKKNRLETMDQRNEKWKFTEIIVYYSDEYATDITDILNKTILQRVP